MKVLSTVYGAAASWRRRWYTRDPSRQRHLTKPVISVGNLRVGGSGKTPVVAHVCALLQSHGERPAILSRGYGRTRPAPGVTVVSDGKAVAAGLAAAGDEPLMLARQLAGVPVLVGAERFQCGQRAERDFDVTVHVLDDGFQHLTLARDIDLLLVDERDPDDAVLPAGRLREPIASAAAAHALLVAAADPGAAARVGSRLGVPTAFHVLRTIHRPRVLGAHAGPHPGARVVAFAGIARPERFFADVAASGRTAAATIAFADHHPYTQRDADRIRVRAQEVGAAAALTTEKDAVRLESLDFGELPVLVLPLSVNIEPANQFAAWLFDRLQRAREASSAAVAGSSLDRRLS